MFHTKSVPIFKEPSFSQSLGVVQRTFEVQTDKVLKRLGMDRAQEKR